MVHGERLIAIVGKVMLRHVAPILSSWWSLAFAVLEGIRVRMACDPISIQLAIRYGNEAKALEQDWTRIAPEEV